ncbi:MAG: 50S ribosomal protein L23 [Mycoplasmataceae bacterium]|jgi:large subunit ribosomal protein L23|nr:50S ribosomal protein L23 [Mycoplasmataceae bacterium]
MHFTDIIVAPYQTEKTYAQQNSATPKYAFIVNPKANKYEIAIAFESIYGHKPVAIATQLKKPVKVRVGTNKPGFSKLTKIAYVTLAKGVNLNPEENAEPIINVPEQNENVSKKEVKVEGVAPEQAPFPKAEKKEVVYTGKEDSQPKPIHHKVDTRSPAKKASKSK